MLQISLELNEHWSLRKIRLKFPKGPNFRSVSWRVAKFVLWSEALAMAWAFRAQELYVAASYRWEFPELIRPCNNVQCRPVPFFFRLDEPTLFTFASSFLRSFSFYFPFHPVTNISDNSRSSVFRPPTFSVAVLLAKNNSNVSFFLFLSPSLYLSLIILYSNTWDSVFLLRVRWKLR